MVAAEVPVTTESGHDFDVIACKSDLLFSSPNLQKGYLLDLKLDLPSSFDFTKVDDGLRRCIETTLLDPATGTLCLFPKNKVTLSPSWVCLP